MPPPRRSLKDLFALLAGILAILYPLLIYWGLGHLAPRVLGGIVLVAFILRTALTGGFAKDQIRLHAPLLAAIAISCGFVMLRNHERLLLFVPVFISLTFCVAIGQTLIWTPTFIERFARRDFPVMPPSAVRYCRNVTILWCGYLFLNACITLGLALFAPLPWWTLYCGLLSYIGMGLLIGVEWIVRRFFEPGFASELAELQARGDLPA